MERTAKRPIIISAHKKIKRARWRADLDEKPKSLDAVTINSQNVLP